MIALRSCQQPIVYSWRSVKSTPRWFWTKKKLMQLYQLSLKRWRTIDYFTFAMGAQQGTWSRTEMSNPYGWNRAMAAFISRDFADQPERFGPFA